MPFLWIINLVDVVVTERPTSQRALLRGWAIPSLASFVILAAGLGGCREPVRPPLAQPSRVAAPTTATADDAHAGAEPARSATPTAAAAASASGNLFAQLAAQTLLPRHALEGERGDRPLSVGAEGLRRAKSYYPFWRWSWGRTRPRAEAIADQLLVSLEHLGPKASEASKVAQFRVAVLAYNDLNDAYDVIATTEREDLCEFMNVAAEAAGINWHNYGSGEGLCSEWRDW